MRRRSFLLLLLVLSTTLSAQQFNGFIHSDLSGILGARVQPASIAGSPYKWDFNIINGNVYITNNLANIEQNGESSTLIRNIDQRTKFLQSNLGLGGLSAMITLPRQQAIGFQYRIRGHISANDLSPEFTAQVNRFTDIRFVNMTVTGQTGVLAGGLWRELAFTYAAVVIDDGYNKWKVGATAKLINSYGSIFGRVRNLAYSIDAAGLALFTDIQFDFGYSANLDPFEQFDGDQELSGLPPRNKAGRALDLGVVFERRANRPAPKTKAGNRVQPDIDYEFRFSASITDFGTMEFAQGNASTSVTGLRPGLGTDIDFDNILSGIGSFREFRDSLATFSEVEQINGRYTVTLPTALNLNYDYNFGNDLYINASAVVDMTRLLPADYRLNYLNSITITPRWEQSRRGLYAPIHVNQLGQVQIGAAARLGVLTLGTQNFSALFSRKRNSFGFFFSISINQLVANARKPYCFGPSRGTSVTRTKRTPLYKRKKFIFF